MAIRHRRNLASVALALSIGVPGALNTPALSASNICDYDQYDWSDLSATEKAAWQTLGYSASMWDKGRDSSVADEDWKDLTPAQKRAAHLLGYTETSWNKGRC